MLTVLAMAEERDLAMARRERIYTLPISLVAAAFLLVSGPSLAFASGGSALPASPAPNASVLAWKHWASQQRAYMSRLADNWHQAFSGTWGGQL